ncbi:hypothetical protein JCM5350_006825 [Sporobolomyces pararoseus]
MSPTAAPLSHADLQAALRTRLIQSGEYSKVMETLRSRLNESNWNDQVRDLAREQARNTADTPHLASLISTIEPQALDLIPEEVRKEIQEMIHEFVKKSVE